MSFKEIELKCPCGCSFIVKSRVKWEDTTAWSKAKEEMLEHLLEAHSPKQLVEVVYEKSYINALNNYLT
jgi:hypothetical protein